MKEHEKIHASTIDSFDCPACNARVTVARTDEGKDMLLHPMPPCDTYVKLSATDYRDLVMRTRAKGRPS